MPLKCLSDEQELFSFHFDEQSWDMLRKQNQQLKHLIMPCCHARVVLKQSKLMTRFFAHARRGDCTTQPETAEHLLAKAQIAKAIEAAGWSVTTEKRGTTPAGEGWIADVLACYGKLSVAIEVQWSRQSDQETAYRQERYKASDVRGLWLFRQQEFVSSKEIPAFMLVFDELHRQFSVKVHAGLYNCQTIDLSRFIIGALSGSLKFAPAIGKEMPLQVFADEIDCWKCKRASKMITHFNIAASQVLNGFSDWSFILSDLEDQPNLPDLLQQILPSPSVLKLSGVGQIKKRYSKTRGQTYISNGCVHCDSLFGSVFVLPSNDPIKIHDSKILLSSALIEAAGGIAYGAKSWWFDESAFTEARMASD